VLSITPVNNQVSVGPAEALEAAEVHAEQPVLTGLTGPAGAVECEVQLRAHGDTVPATVTIDGRQVTARLHRPVRGVAAGQALVLYRPDLGGDIVLGSATITGSTPTDSAVVSDPARRVVVP
jgi:tRNA-specific 2-thiouridylase